jgi:hypothetical protein
MNPRPTPLTDAFYSLFDSQTTVPGRPSRSVRGDQPRELPDPQTGRPLQVANVEHTDRTICPSCAQLGSGAYVSFVSDLRLAFACPSCRTLTFTAGT